jgi:hypothetical protein
MAAAEYDWAMFRNDDITLTVSVVDAAGTVVPLTNAVEITFAMSKKKADGTFSTTAALTKKKSTGGVVVTSTTGGKFNVVINSNDTESLSPADYYYEVELIDAGGDVGTCLIGTVELKKDLILNP